MEYLTDEQMKKEKPLKIKGVNKLNALEKYLNQNCNIVVNGKRALSASRISIFFAPRKNQVVVMN